MPAVTKKQKILVSVDRDDLAALDSLCSDYKSFTANQLLSAAAGELAKVKREPGALWHALARIAEDDEEAETGAQREPARPKRTRPRIHPSPTPAVA